MDYSLVFYIFDDFLIFLALPIVLHGEKVGKKSNFYMEKYMGKKFNFSYGKAHKVNA
jgi:hypothetical protein